jgi:hypothetical protein
MAKRGRPAKYPWTTLPVDGAFLVDKRIPPDHVRSIASRAGRKYGRRFRCTETEFGTIVTRRDLDDLIPFSTAADPVPSASTWPVPTPSPTATPLRQDRKGRQGYGPERIAEQLIGQFGVEGARLIAAKIFAALEQAPGGIGHPVRRHLVFPLRPEHIMPTHEPVATVMVPPRPPAPQPAEPEPEKAVADEDWFPPSAG